MLEKIIKKTPFAIVVLCLLAAVPAQGQDSIYSFGGDAAVVSKYIWRGQRLTNDWSLQPSATVGIGGFSFNVWGNMDLTAVNEGDALFIPENPDAPPGDHAGLRGQFSEIDYTFSFARSLENVSFDSGAIFYTFPERTASLAATTELYGSVSLDSVPLAPSATLYVDVDETGDSGSTGLYFLLGAGHSFGTSHDVFPAVDISASLSFVNGGFGDFYYGLSESGAHDFGLSLSVPIQLNENWSASAFVSYNALLGDFRNVQCQDPREVFKGTSGGPGTLADTVWGGLSLSLAF